MKILLVIAIFALVPTSVQAWELIESCTFSRFYGRNCRTTYIESQPRNLAQELEDEKARRASIEKWEAFCKPKRTYDSEGVIRLVYTQKGCEFGRSE